MFVTFPAMPIHVTSPYDRALATAQPSAAATSEPARVVGSLALLIDVLRDIGSRSPETLSASEADLQALFDDQTEDLLSIFDRAKEEMIAETASAARAGGEFETCAKCGYPQGSVIRDGQRIGSVPCRTCARAGVA